MHLSFFRILGIAAFAAILLGCNSTKKQDNCPSISAMADASAQTIFRKGTTPDPSNVLYTVELVSVTGACDFQKKKHTADSDLTLTFRATRAPTGDEADYSVPYFVGVTYGADDCVVAKQVYSAPFSFAAGQSTVTFTDSVGSAKLKAGEGKQTYDYQILVGLALTKEQYDYDKTHGSDVQ